MEKILIIANPSAGKYSEFNIEKVRTLFHKEGLTVSLYLTKKKGDAKLRAKRAIGKYDVVIAAGGDGTINEVVNGLANSKTPLGILPIGTENVLAQEFKIPRHNIIKAAKIILKKKKKTIDLGIANGNYFTFVAGAGFDAHVAAKTKTFLKKIIGSNAYSITAFQEIFKYKPSPITVEANGKVYGGTFVMVSNSELYGAKLSFAPKSKIDDGLLWITIMKTTDLFSILKYGLGATLRRVNSFADVEQFTVTKATIKSEKKVLVHTDAEIIGTTPVKISICPKCLDVLVA